MENILIEVQSAIEAAEKKHGKELDIPSISKEAAKRQDDRRSALYMIPSAHMAKLTTDHRTKEKQLSWADIAVEELAEAVNAKDDSERREELIQLAAVAVRWVSMIDEAVKAKKEAEAKLKR